MNNSLKPSMSIGQSFLSVLKNLSNYSGRARRSEFWWFTAILGVVTFGVLVNVWVHLTINGFFDDEDGVCKLIMLCAGVFAFFYLFISSVTVRRLHDVNKSGWWLIPGLIPVVGTLMICFLLSEDSDVEENKFGASPKYVEAQPEAVAKKSPSSFFGVLSLILVFVASIMFALYNLGLIFSNQDEEEDAMIEMLENQADMEALEEQCIQVVDETPVTVEDEDVAVVVEDDANAVVVEDDKAEAGN